MHYIIALKIIQVFAVSYMELLHSTFLFEVHPLFVPAQHTNSSAAVDLCLNLQSFLMLTAGDQVLSATSPC